MLDVLSALLGFPCDDSKSVSEAMEMALLGVEVAVVWARRLVTMVVAQAKAQTWAASLDESKQSGRMTEGEADRMAGRLSFAVTASGQQSGRAFIKPFHAQTATTFVWGRDVGEPP